VAIANVVAADEWYDVHLDIRVMLELDWNFPIAAGI